MLLIKDKLDWTLTSIVAIQNCEIYVLERFYNHLIGKIHYQMDSYQKSAKCCVCMLLNSKLVSKTIVTKLTNEQDKRRVSWTWTID